MASRASPPDQDWETHYDQLTLSNVDPTNLDNDLATVSTNVGSGVSTRDSRNGSSGGSSPEMPSKPRADKKDKYREKNRVAAAKCRAKKKSHVDVLEENHRTQSMLNSLLKQTEQSLRDELSFWRTQALQHAYCDCQAVQDYNLNKARALAGHRDFGGLDAVQHDTSCSAALPSDGHGSQMQIYPSPDDFDIHAG